MRHRPTAIFLLALLGLPGLAWSQNHQAYTYPTGSAGNRAIANDQVGGSFTATQSITVSQLGAFRDGAAEWTTSKITNIYRASDQVLLATVTIAPAEANTTIVGQYRLKSITPVTIPAGTACVIGTSGYDGDLLADPNAPPGAATLDGGGGLVTFTGQGLYSTVANACPTNAGGTPAAGFGAPTMVYAATGTVAPTPAPLALGALTASVSPTGITITAPAATGGSGTVTSYKLYRSGSLPFSPPTTGTLVATSATTTLIDPNPGSGVVFFRVVVTDSAGATATSTQTANLTAAEARLPTKAEVLGFLGDSITAGVNVTNTGGGPNAAQTCTVLLASQGLCSATSVNRGQPGTATVDWGSSGTLLPPAIAAFKAGGVTTVFVGLGMNDARTDHLTTPSAYQANLTAIAGALTSNGFRVVLNGPTCPSLANGISAAGTATAWTEASVSLLAQYGPTIPAIANGTTILAGDLRSFDTFANHPELFSDGVHPGANGYPVLGGAWASSYLAATTPVAAVSTDPGVANVLALTTYTINGAPRVGTYVPPAGGSLTVAQAATLAQLQSALTQGFVLAPTGLDGIATTPAARGTAPNFRQMQVAAWRRWYSKTAYDGATLTGYADDGVTPLTVQPLGNVNGLQIQGAPH